MASINPTEQPKQPNSLPHRRPPHSFYGFGAGIDSVPHPFGHPGPVAFPGPHGFHFWPSAMPSRPHPRYRGEYPHPPPPGGSAPEMMGDHPPHSPHHRGSPGLPGPHGPPPPESVDFDDGEFPPTYDICSDSDCEGEFDDMNTPETGSIDAEMEAGEKSEDTPEDVPPHSRHARGRHNRRGHYAHGPRGFGPFGFGGFAAFDGPEDPRGFGHSHGFDHGRHSRHGPWGKFSIFEKGPGPHEFSRHGRHGKYGRPGAGLFRFEKFFGYDGPFSPKGPFGGPGPKCGPFGFGRMKGFGKHGKYGKHHHGKFGKFGPWGPFGPGPHVPQEDGVVVPPVDIFQAEESFIVHVSLPGGTRESVNISWDEDKSALLITGEIPSPFGTEDLESLHSERRTGKVHRWVMLPPFEYYMDSDKEPNGESERMGKKTKTTIDVGGIEALMQDGVLVVTVPKKEQEHAEKVEINIQ